MSYKQDPNIAKRFVGAEQGRSPDMDLTGKVFTWVTVLKYAGYIEQQIPGKSYINKIHYYSCKCKCGTVWYAKEQQLKNGMTKSCGCYSKSALEKFNSEVASGEIKREATNKTHNMSNDVLYRRLADIKSRCNNKKNSSYENYGGRGIKVCEEWSQKNGIVNFAKWAMENGYTQDKWCYIDRINTDGDFEPSNCRVVMVEDKHHDRNKNTYVDFYGTKYTVAEMASRFGVDNELLSQRLWKKYNINEAIQLPQIPGINKDVYKKNHPNEIHEWETIVRPVYMRSHPNIDINDPRLLRGMTPDQIEKAEGITKEDNDRKLDRLKQNFN